MLGGSFGGGGGSGGASSGVPVVVQHHWGWGLPNEKYMDEEAVNKFKKEKEEEGHGVAERNGQDQGGDRNSHDHGRGLHDYGADQEDAKNMAGQIAGRFSGKLLPTDLRHTTKQKDIVKGGRMRATFVCKETGVVDDTEGERKSRHQA